MARSKAAPASRIYQIKITLRDIDPPIWRRLQVPGKTTLPDLHLMIQAVMGWDNGHLHGYTIRDVSYSAPDPDFDDSEFEDETRVRLDKVCPRARASFLYIYDFGDCWEHDILVEKILPPEPVVDYPRCLAGERRCPPEDVGGVYGYEDFLKAMRNPKHKEHAHYLEWCGGEFNPEEFDVDAVNGFLADYKLLDDGF